MLYRDLRTGATIVRDVRLSSVRTEEKLAEIMVKAAGDYESGKVLMEQLGAAGI